MSDPNFWGFTRYEIELTKETTEAHVLNFIIYCINSNAAQKINKRGDKYTAHLSRSTVNTRLFWVTEKMVRSAIDRLKKKNIVETIYNDYNIDRYRIYTLSDKIYGELYEKNYFQEGKKSKRGSSDFARPSDLQGRPSDLQGRNNNSSNNILKKEEEEKESATASIAPVIVDRVKTAHCKDDAIAIITHYNALGIIKHTLSAHLIKDVMDLLKKRPRPLHVHIDALDNFSLAFKGGKWTQKWTLPLFLKRASAVDHFYEENFIPEKWHADTGDNIRLSQLSPGFQAFLKDEWV